MTVWIHERELSIITEEAGSDMKGTNHVSVRTIRQRRIRFAKMARRPREMNELWSGYCVCWSACRASAVRALALPSHFQVWAMYCPSRGHHVGYVLRRLRSLRSSVFVFHTVSMDCARGRVRDLRSVRTGFPALGHTLFSHPHR